LVQREYCILDRCVDLNKKDLSDSEILTCLLPSLVTDAELERLQQALRILSDAEKQIRLSSERSTWFTAALLQLGSGHNSEITQSRSSSKQSAKATSETMMEAMRESSASRSTAHHLSTFPDSKKIVDLKTTSGHSSPHASLSSRMRHNENMIYAEHMSVDRALLDSAQTSISSEQKGMHSGISDNLTRIWMKCIENCHSKTLRQLLYDHGKLTSVKECEGKHIMYSVSCPGYFNVLRPFVYKFVLVLLTTGLELELPCYKIMRHK
jgi:DNA polymerase III gamma/tau subunit